MTLLDLYGLGNCPPSKKSASERLEWARRDMEGKVGDPRFFQFFAVHEVEAWLLSDLSIFPGGISSSLKGTSVHPEDVDLDEPPARLLNRVYKSITGRNYLKVTYGQQLFKKLDPSVSYAKCPHLKQLLDKMLDLAQTSKPVSG